MQMKIIKIDKILSYINNKIEEYNDSSLWGTNTFSEYKYKRGRVDAYKDIKKFIENLYK